MRRFYFKIGDWLLNYEWVTPNRLTIYRAVLLLPPLLLFIANGWYVAAVLIMCVSYYMDSLDGYIARLLGVPDEAFPENGSFLEKMAYRGKSEWGAERDAFVDKLTFLWILDSLLIFSQVFSHWNGHSMEAVTKGYLLAVTTMVVLLMVRAIKMRLGVTSSSNIFGKLKVWIQWAGFMSILCSAIRFPLWFPIERLPVLQVWWELLTLVFIYTGIGLSVLSMCGHIKDMLQPKRSS